MRLPCQGKADAKQGEDMRRKIITALMLTCMVSGLMMGCSKETAVKEDVVEAESEEKEVVTTDDVIETESEEKATADEEVTIEQEFEFYTDEEGIYYINLPDTMEIDGGTYSIIEGDTTYEKTETMYVIQQVLDADVEELEDIEDTIEYTAASGKTYTLKNEQVYIQSTGEVMVPVTYTEVYTNQYGKPSVSSTKTFSTYSKYLEEDVSIIGTLTSFYESTAGHWASVLQIDGIFEADGNNADVYSLSGSNYITVSQSASTPTWEGYESDILTSLGLNQSYFRITSAEWNGDQYVSEGLILRNCVFLGDAYVSDYTAVYDGYMETNGYSTKVFYMADAEEVDAVEKDITTVYKIKAVVKYKLIEG